MEKGRQALYYLIAAGLFGIAFLTQAARHGFGTKTFVAALLAMILAALAMRSKREQVLEDPSED